MFKYDYYLFGFEFSAISENFIKTIRNTLYKNNLRIRFACMVDD